MEQSIPVVEGRPVAVCFVQPAARWYADFETRVDEHPAMDRSPGQTVDRFSHTPLALPEDAGERMTEILYSEA